MRIATGAALWLGPDPVQPFAGSRYAQTQIFEVEPGGSVGLVDWVTEGRSARGERWAMDGWRGKNEIWEVRKLARNEKVPPPALETTTKKAESNHEQEREQNPEEQEHKVLKIRDNLILQRDPITGVFPSLSSSSSPSPTRIGVFGTLILHGPLFTPLSKFLLSEFSLLPRIGARNWDDEDNTAPPSHSAAAPRENMTPQQQQQRWRAQRQQQEQIDGILWTAARVRGGTTVVKFSAREVEGGRRWLRGMLRAEELEGEEEEEKGEGGGGLEKGEGEGKRKEREGERERGIARMFGEGAMMFLR